MDKKECVLKAVISQVLLGIKHHIPSAVLLEILIMMFASILDELKGDAKLSNVLLTEWSLDYLLMLDENHNEAIPAEMRNALATSLLGFLEGDPISEDMQDKIEALRKGTGMLEPVKEDLSVYTDYLDGKND